MVAIPGGEFKMGSPINEKNRSADEGPQRKVVVDSFWMAKHETTWNLFQLYMDREIDKLPVGWLCPLPRREVVNS